MVRIVMINGSTIDLHDGRPGLLETLVSKLRSDGYLQTERFYIVGNQVSHITVIPIDLKLLPEGAIRQ